MSAEESSGGPRMRLAKRACMSDWISESCVSLIVARKKSLVASFRTAKRAIQPIQISDLEERKVVR